MWPSRPHVRARSSSWKATTTPSAVTWTSVSRYRYPMSNARLERRQRVLRGLAGSSPMGERQRRRPLQEGVSLRRLRDHGSASMADARNPTTAGAVASCRRTPALRRCPAVRIRDLPPSAPPAAGTETQVTPALRWYRVAWLALVEKGFGHQHSSIVMSVVHRLSHARARFGWREADPNVSADQDRCSVPRPSGRSRVRPRSTTSWLCVMTPVPYSSTSTEPCIARRRSVGRCYSRLPTRPLGRSCDRCQGRPDHRRIPSGAGGSEGDGIRG